MDRSNVSLVASSAVRICCDRFENNDWSGRLYTRYEEEPIDFHTVRELLEYLEEFYNWLGYPQASMENRSFQKSLKKKNFWKTITTQENGMDHKEEKIVVAKEEVMNKHQGEKATFVVKIQYRQNASWQGHVTWAEKNKTVPFRSALELLKLIDATENVSEESWDRGGEQL